MASPFSRTLRALEADGFRWSLWSLLGAGLLLAGAGTWFVAARTPVYETTETARLEVERAAHPVAALVAGRVAATHLALGATVKAGDVLVELESELERLQLEEQRARLAAFVRRREALRQQIAAEERAWPEARRAAALAVDEARARSQESEATAQFAQGEAARLKSLNQDKLLAESDLRRAEAEAQKDRAAADAQSLLVRRLQSEAESKERNHLTRMAELEREGALLEGEIGRSQASINRQEHVLEQRRIRAPVSGELGEVAELSAGWFLSEGQKVGAIIPAGELKLVAQFAPRTALGRIRPGQPARFRLNGFPWTQYGSVPARVTSVANEPREAQLRVELAVQRHSLRGVELRHGMSGMVEVEIDRVSPCVLVLRAAGKLLAAPRRSAAPAAIDQRSEDPFQVARRLHDTGFNATQP